MSIRWSRSQWWHHNVRRLVRSLGRSFARRFANLGPLRSRGARDTASPVRWRVGCHVPCTLTQLIHIMKTVLPIAPSLIHNITSGTPRTCRPSSIGLTFPKSDRVTFHGSLDGLPRIWLAICVWPAVLQRALVVGCCHSHIIRSHPDS